MKHPQQSWQQLVAAARIQRDEREETAPYGFAGRVAAQAFAQSQADSWGLMEKFAVRGLIAACTFGIAAVAFGFTALTTEHDDEVATTDSVSEILDQLS